MSSKIYIELDSTRRNRNVWKKPGQFNIDTGNIALNSSTEANDGVSDAMPLISWSGLYFNTTALGDDYVDVVLELPSQLGNKTRSTLLIVNSSNLNEKTNYYRNAVLTVSTNPIETSKILEYIPLGNNRHEIKLETPVTIDYSQTYTIRDSTDFQDPANAYLFVPFGSNLDNIYNGFYLTNETRNETVTITDYRGGLLHIKDINPAWLAEENYSIRKHMHNGQFVVPGSSTESTIDFPVPQPDGTYTGYYLRILRFFYDTAPSPPEGEVRRIVSFINNTATVFPPFSALPIGLNIELLPFAYDNSIKIPIKQNLADNPLYSLRLLRLTLPTVSIDGGGTILDKRYVYVSLSTLTNETSRILLSNNESSVTAKFTCSLNFHSSDITRPFITLDGDDIQQDVLFNINSFLAIKITTSDGIVFNPILSDTESPSEPNPDLQIRALFELTPLGYSTSTVIRRNY